MQHFQFVHRSGGNGCSGSGEGVRDDGLGEAGEGDGGGGGGSAFSLVGIIGVGVVVDCGLWICGWEESCYLQRRGGGVVSQVGLFFDVDFKMEFGSGSGIS